ncbi:MAG: class I SAM-dependent methyltransferase [Chloroflexia bacterium]|nr:class I SAM-dependent methyltransferase [Chloroflexia bacterium]
MTAPGEIERVRRYYDRIAARYDEDIGRFEKRFFGDDRRWVCSRAAGDVLEIAIGTGRNLAFYPPAVRLTGIDLTPAMLDVARRHAAALGREIDLRVGNAQALDLPDAGFDTVVATLALCSIPDIRGAVAEVRRVLRPGGRFLLVEHVRSPVLPVRAVQRVLNPIFVRCYGDHLLREPLDHLAAAGFVVEQVERSKWGIIERAVARNPATRLA